MRLDCLLRRDANNLDLFRVVAACMVIYGHAYAIAPQNGHHDWLESVVGYDYFGSIAVKIFFFISGLVVTNSLLIKQKPISFIVARLFRIWPALLAIILITTFIIGPIYTTFPLGAYFNNEQFSVVNYIVLNIKLDTQYYLPGVFFENPYEAAINGSLWTLYHEVGMYIGLLLFFLLGIFKDKVIATFFLLVVFISRFGLNTEHLHRFFQQPILVQCFVLGSLMAFHKSIINIRFGSVFLSWLFFCVFKDMSWAKYCLYFSVFITILYLSSLKYILKIKPKADISYGIYLWGFPIQQVLAYHFLSLGVVFNQIASILICIIIGCMSWVLIEKHSIYYGCKVSDYLNFLWDNYSVCVKNKVLRVFY